MKNKNFSHTFVLTTFKKSKYLEKCLKSLINQKTKSEIIITTSKPFDGLKKISKKYGIKLFIFKSHKNIANDWNRGLKKAKTKWVTIAHQDDIYLPEYTENIKKYITKYNRANLIFTDYAQIIKNKVKKNTLLLTIKRIILNIFFLGRNEIQSKINKINCLRFGCPIPCPTVTIKKKPGKYKIFNENYKINIDWLAWLNFAKKNGSFVRINKVLLYHRIHKTSETSKAIKFGYRQIEDKKILGLVWPNFIARTLAFFYQISYKKNIL